MNRILTGLGALVFTIILLGALYLTFIVLPVALVNERDCLRAGYPRAHTTFNLETYCSTLDGSEVIPR